MADDKSLLSEVLTGRTALRIVLAIAGQTAVIAIIQGAPLTIKIMTVFLAGLGLLLLQFETRLRAHHIRLTPSLLALSLIYIALVAYAIRLQMHPVQKTVMLNVDISKSPWPIPEGTNQIFAASGRDSDTELILPFATGSGGTHTVKKTDSNPHQVAVVPHGSDTIDGTKSAVDITIQNDVVRFVDRDRGQWVIE